MLIAWKPSASKDLDRLDQRQRRRVVAAIERYAETGLGDVARLQAVDPPEYRLRVGTWRVRFEFDTEAGAVVVLRVLPRGGAYRDL